MSISAGSSDSGSNNDTAPLPPSLAQETPVSKMQSTLYYFGISSSFGTKGGTVSRSHVPALQ